jgi:hypothetical protein
MPKAGAFRVLFRKPSPQPGWFLVVLLEEQKGGENRGVEEVYRSRCGLWSRQRKKTGGRVERISFRGRAVVTEESRVKALAKNKENVGAMLSGVDT